MGHVPVGVNSGCKNSFRCNLCLSSEHESIHDLSSLVFSRERIQLMLINDVIITTESIIREK